MWSNVVFGNPKWPKSDFQNGRRRPFWKNKKFECWSEMARNAFKSDFRSSKMAAAAILWTKIKKLRIDLKLREMRSKVIFRSLITFSLFCHEASQGGCWWTAKIWIWLNHFKGPKKVKFGCFATFCQFSKKRFDNFSLFFVHSFLGMTLINCQEMDFIELFKRSFSR